ncbi:phosphopantetheine-binding protein, partial [Micromonospora sp. NPDC049257]|uniref:phosphopantetheine-binding protein n=1 Tax=Micromonospora sp. NPDC049257 TaxID=3155771 RepID=UPI00342D1A29
SGGVVVPTLRRGEGGVGRVLLSLGEAFVAGVEVDWGRVVPEAVRVDLPTYPFQHEHYWLKTTPSGVTTDRGDHALLGAPVELPGSGGVVLTGTVSLAGLPWLAAHTVGDTVVLPGTALLDLALKAGDDVGLDHVDALTLHEPLTVPARAAVHLRVEIGAPGDDARRPLSIHARRADTPAGAPWRCHASGTLAAGVPSPGVDLTVWPPPAATGEPAADGVARWRRDGEVFAEVRLPDRQRAEADQFGLHPVLLDAALRAVDDPADAPSRLAELRGVTLRAVGATVLRVHRAASGQVTVADTTGSPVATIAAVTTRPCPTGEVRTASAAAQDGLFRVEWVPVSTPATPPSPPTMVVVGADPLRARAGLMSADTYAEAYPDLAALTAAVEAGAARPDVILLSDTDPAPSADSPWETSRLVTLRPDPTAAAPRRRGRAGTTGTAAVPATAVPATAVPATAVPATAVPATAVPATAVPATAVPAGAVPAGATPAHGDTVVVDGVKASWRALTTALALAEPHLVVRRGTVLTPRLARVTVPVDDATPPDVTGPVLVTGGASAARGATVAFLRGCGIEAGDGSGDAATTVVRLDHPDATVTSATPTVALLRERPAGDLSPDELVLVEAACRVGGSLVVAAGAGAWSRSPDAPALLRSLAPAGTRRTARAVADAPAGLKQRLVLAPEGDRDQILLELVRRNVAAVLGLASAETVERDRRFRDAGFDSLSALTVRNLISTETDLRLAPTVVFDHSTPDALVRHLRQELLGY